MSAVVEPGLSELDRRVSTSGRLRATTDADRGCRRVASSAWARPATRTAACASTTSLARRPRSASFCEPRTSYHVVCIRSTVLPGTIESMRHPVARAALGQEGGTRLRRLHESRVSPRRIVDQGLLRSAVHDHRRNRRPQRRRHRAAVRRSFRRQSSGLSSAWPRW